MPRFNGTGPLGAGPCTGLGRGPCGVGMARGRGRGCAFGWGYGPYQAQPTQKEEAEMLTEEAGVLENELKNIKQRLVELKTKK